VPDTGSGDWKSSVDNHVGRMNSVRAIDLLLRQSRLSYQIRLGITDYTRFIC